jgi:hypothetical protein
MPGITDVAEAFFAACETGRGWEVCRAYCRPNATFSAQAEPLLEVKTLEQYTDWMKGLMTVLPDARYEVFSRDAHGRRVVRFHQRDEARAPITFTSRSLKITKSST